MRLRCMCDKELAAACILSGKRHSNCSCLVFAEIDLVANLVTRPSVLIAARVAALNDEVGNHSYEREAVIETAPDEANEIVHGHRGIGRKQLDANIALFCVDHRGWILD